MKKIGLFLVAIAIILVGFLVYRNIPKTGEHNNSELIKKQAEEIPVIESDDLFGDYYGKAEVLLKKMSLEEKIGQLFLVRYDVNTSKKQIVDYYAGGFVLFARDFQNHTKKSIKKELDERQNLSKIPLALAVDEEGGYVTRVSRYPAFRSEKFKSNKTLFETGGYELVEANEILI